MRLRGVLFSLVIFIILFSVSPVWAQTETSPPSANLSTPDLEDFPIIEAYLDVREPSGKFVSGLQADDVLVIEDLQQLPVKQLQQFHPGVQLVLALNGGSALAIQNSQGASRAELIAQALSRWATSRRGSTIDDLSMLLPNSEVISHLSDPIDWISALNLGAIDLRQFEPNLDILFRAVEKAADPTPRTGMNRSVLFITPPIASQDALSTENLIARANQLGVNINVWMVPDPGVVSTTAEGQLKNLAAQTGGQFFLYSEANPTLDLEEIIGSVRTVYRLTYQSQIRTAGTHQLAAEVQTSSGTVTTPVQNFEVLIYPPDPAFIAPPLEIQRLPPLDENGEQITDTPVDEFTPDQQELQILITFPDERVRPIVRTALFVDGQQVAERTEEPFDQFVWDLKNYQTSGSHTLRVEAQDSFGLTGSSIEKIVQVLVLLPPRNPWSWVTQNLTVLSILAVVVLGAVLLLVLVLGGRIRPATPGRRKQARRRSDPVTQPVVVKKELPARKAGWASRIHWPQRHIAPKALAFLSRISDDESAQDVAMVPITTTETTLGSDPNLATLVLDDPTVEGLHSRLIQGENGSFRLTDEGSIAGTWINYSPVSREGAALEHGDLVHIGRVGFRFSLRQPGIGRKPVVKHIEDQEKPEP